MARLSGPALPSGNGRCRRWLGGLTVGLLGALASGSLVIAAYAGSPAPAEPEVKAALLYKFAKFVEWPEPTFADRQTPTGVCVLGADDILRALDALSEQTIKGRKTAVRRLDHWSRPSGDCHIVFIGQLRPYQLAATLDDLQGQPILTIGDAPEFASSGGVLGLKTVDKRIRFEINLDAAEKAGLAISSQVLSLATVLPRQNK